ncbi:MAG: hypothetical protein N4A33_09230 [Bacteriovoracaceae bacterium]|jgi:hypothetical protein|nr:hypothetical protein [Bacteriovoracaceae bacterium]
MQLKNQISFARYTVFTLAHIGASFYYFGKNNYLTLSVLFASFLVNQISLIVMIKKMLFVDSDQRDNTGIFILFLIKFLTLVGGIYYGMQFFHGNKLIIIGNYIFQLIILVLSIKRYSKKN